VKSFLLLLSLLAFVELHSQTVVSGKVRDQKGRPLAGVSISIKDAYDGGTSDSVGNFSFRSQERGERIIQLSSIGYITVEKSVTLSGEPLKIDFSMKEEPSELKAVVITAGTFEASDSKRTTVLNSIDIVTTASANADVTSAIRTLPGTQQVGEKEGLFVRGGTAGETKIFIDGTLVNNFFFTGAPDIASRGRFSPFLFKGTVFSSGGYSAQYGQALSSVLLLESIDLPERSEASLGISTVGLSAGYQQLAKNKKSSWGGSYNYTNLLPYFLVVKQKPDYFKMPAFHNADFNYRVKTSRTGILKFYGYFNSNVVGMRRPDIDSVSLKDAFDLNNFNLYTNLSWKESLGSKWKMNIGLSWSTNTDKIVNELQDAGNMKQAMNKLPFNQKNYRVNNNSSLAVAKMVFERRLKGLTAIRFGGEYFYNNAESLFSNDTIAGFSSAVTDRLKAVFAETDIYITNDLAAKIGTRVEHSSHLDKANIAPRISLAYKIANATQVSLAYGTFYQSPENSFYLRGYKYNNLDYTKATHYILNFQKLTRDYTLRAEAFYKKYENLV
jgi:vitamin B12 transporter